MTYDPNRIPEWTVTGVVLWSGGGRMFDEGNTIKLVPGVGGQDILVVCNGDMKAVSLSALELIPEY